MKPVFADTGFFLALVNARDQYHQAATSLNASLVTPLLTTAWVLLEFANAIATSRARSEFGSTLARLRSERDAEIIAPSPELFDRGCELYTSRSDKEWSLTDCISFVVMKERGLTDALTPDRHFEQAGFKVCSRFDSSDRLLLGRPLLGISNGADTISLLNNNGSHLVQSQSTDCPDYNRSIGCFIGER